MIELNKKNSYNKHGMTNTKILNIWNGIKTRCNNKNRWSYKYYGGKGIMCAWNSFEDFKNDMYEDYLKHAEKFGEKNTTIERIDTKGNYCKENCKWATMKEQSNNKSNNVLITYKGEILTLKQWSEKLCINYMTLFSRLNRGKWTIEKAFSTL